MPAMATSLSMGTAPWQRRKICRVTVEQRRHIGKRRGQTLPVRRPGWFAGSRPYKDTRGAARMPGGHDGNVRAAGHPLQRYGYRWA